MKTNVEKYTSPKADVIVLISEECVLAGSGLGGNEELLEDPDDYIDFFE
ncbi:MAG: hypothetical protein IJ450_03200 [Bacteroidales bacterium]|jgi:hypothetical protein|nr:hypothetical protein [Bacteroidales bacterium]